jgi:hypothetical protein
VLGHRRVGEELALGIGALGIELVDAVEEGWKRRTEVVAEPATVADLEDAAQLAFEILGGPELRVVDRIRPATSLGANGRSAGVGV